MDGILNERMVQATIDQAVEKVAALKRDKMKLKKKNESKVHNASEQQEAIDS